MSELDHEAFYVVVGAGITGYSCVHYLVEQGYQVAMTDDRDDPPYTEKIKQNFPQVDTYFGAFNAEVLAAASCIVMSPGINSLQPPFDICIQRGIPIIGDVELFARSVAAPVVAITGTNGKSTVTTLLGEMAKQSGKHVAVGGNVGTPLLDFLTQQDKAYELFILELSSFQLETTQSLRPIAATILNITEDHLDRHGSIVTYIKAKRRIYIGAQGIVFNRDDKLTMPNNTNIPAHSFGSGVPDTNDDFGWCEQDEQIYLTRGSEQLININELKIKGRQNWLNALAALALGEQIGLPMLSMLAALRQFTGLAHRCQLVRSIGGVDWFNDSKGTNVGACIAAIEGLAEQTMGKMILIAGGQGKGADFSQLADIVAQKVDTVILFGEDAKIIATALQESAQLKLVEDLSQAIDEAKQMTQAGDIVLFSPACASFDMFDNFEHRGNVFINYVRAL